MANVFTQALGAQVFKEDVARLGVKSKFSLREALLDN